MQGHRGEKRYICPHCEKGFVDLGNFKRHKLIHTGERPFECKECGKRFTQSAHLKKHVNTQHVT
uniref:C2H2-type domain-containing protein n=2 Tax=Sinocyclocheilus rhinocerous TaxID=307959 RepID=A0A673NAT4_9TELE